MNIRHVAAAVMMAAAAMTLTACDNNDEPEHPQASLAPAPSPADAATISQYASLLASHDREWREQLETTEEDCRSIDLHPSTCKLGYMTLGLQAELIEILLGGARDNPDSPGYLGDPPAEVADLVERTLAAARAASDAVEAWLEAECADILDRACTVEARAMRWAVNDVTRSLDAWRPYM